MTIANTAARQSTQERWGTRWLNMLAKSKVLANEDLERGQAYALHDWQLEVDLEPGQASVTARSGPRVRNRAVITVPTFSEREVATIVGLLASSSARTAAVLDHELDLSLFTEAKQAGVNLLPRPKSLRPECSCRNWGELCKHASAILHLLGDVFDEAPFDLLLWRGLPYEDLVEQVRDARRSEGGDGPDEDRSDEEPNASQDADESTTKAVSANSGRIDAAQAWAASAERPAAPGPIKGPPEPVVVPPYPSEAPSNAPFTSHGLHSLLSDAVGRAHGQRVNKSDSALSLPLDADLARRAAAAEGSDGWARLVRNSSLASRELSTSANAWRIAGADGVRIIQSSNEVIELSKTVQLRRDAGDQWFRFEKVSGRWQLIEGPAIDQNQLRRADEVLD